MEYKVMFAGDLHKRSKDITTIEGYVNCTTAVQRSLIQTIRDLEVTHFVSLGDWYDKGYSDDVSAGLADYDLDIQMSQLLNGNFYGVIGNHIRLSLDSNPELHLIQPHNVLKSRRPIIRDTQVIKTPEILRLNDVQISLMHNMSDAEDVLEYLPIRQCWAKYHIAVFHTQSIVPNSALLNTNYNYNTSSNTKIGKVLQDVDLAIVGHIHDNIGKVIVNTEKGSVMMIIPGSLTNVNSSENGRHTSISIPIVSITESSEVKLEFLPFDLKTNMLTFKKKNVEKAREKLKSVRGNPKENLYTELQTGIVNTKGIEELTSLNAFMKAKNYTQMDKDLIRSVLQNPESIEDLVNIFIKQRNL